jgi:hypothetical protein
MPPGPCSIRVGPPGKYRGTPRYFFYSSPKGRFLVRTGELPGTLGKDLPKDWDMFTKYKSLRPQTVGPNRFPFLATKGSFCIGKAGSAPWEGPFLFLKKLDATTYMRKAAYSEEQPTNPEQSGSCTRVSPAHLCTQACSTTRPRASGCARVLPSVSECICE